MVDDEERMLTDLRSWMCVFSRKPLFVDLYLLPSTPYNIFLPSVCLQKRFHELFFLLLLFFFLFFFKYETPGCEPEEHPSLRLLSLLPPLLLVVALVHAAAAAV